MANNKQQQVLKAVLAYYVGTEIFDRKLPGGLSKYGSWIPEIEHQRKSQQFASDMYKQLNEELARIAATDVEHAQARQRVLEMSFEEQRLTLDRLCEDENDR
jgi:hypothetical protein